MKMLWNGLSLVIYTNRRRFMRYMGGKSRISKNISEIINNEIDKNGEKCFVSLFKTKRNYLNKKFEKYINKNDEYY